MNARNDKSVKKIKYLGVIPARGGSKGIPLKNIKMIAGKPLIAWTVEAAKSSALLDRFIVSTEDPRITAVAKKRGAEVFPRPARLAGDNVTTLEVLRDIIKKIETENVVLLQPTSPVRDPDLIDSCIKEFERTGADSLATGFMCKFKEYGSANLPRQKLGGFFYDDGNVYVIKTSILKKGDRFGKKIARLIIGREQNVEIDDKFDFWVAEQVLAKIKKGV